MNNIFTDKKVFRKVIIEKRKKFADSKNEKDALIYNRLTSSSMFKNATAVLTYVSKDFEVATTYLISHCLDIGKQIAAPQCDRDEMIFRVICNMSQLQKSTFGVYEPHGSCVGLTKFINTICIVPGLSFGNNGMRIGYGKGYYDRFLKNYNGISVGLCYDDFIGEVPYEPHDIAVDVIITESNTIYCNNL